MVENDDTLARIIETLKEPVRIDQGLDRRVMEAISVSPGQSEPAARRHTRANWLWRSHTFRLSPIGGVAIAAVLAGIFLIAGRLGSPERAPTVQTQDQSGVATPNAGPSIDSGQTMQFVLIAPEARSVTLVGDFNDWSFSATPLARQQSDGVWWVTVELSPGRYRYAFVVDGATWQRDPSAPAAEDEFGRPNSVVTIGGA